MNKARRDKLAEAMRLLYQAMDIVEACRDEEDMAYYNLPDSLQESEKGQGMVDNIDSMDEIKDGIESLTMQIDDIIL